MNIASIGMPLIWGALAAIALSTMLFAAAAFRKDIAGSARNMQIDTASGVFLAGSLLVVAVCTVHASLLLTHDFDIDYGYRYSSRELPPGYLFATFWAGQDGSFLLWSFWIAILGLILSRSSSGLVRARVMSVYAPVLLFILVILIVRNPFTSYVPDPGQPLHPLDGIGLNPLLENPWMVVHPPTLFLGFAGLTVPFAFALSALIWDDDPDWYRRAWPWALFTFATLGLGVMLGGFWAYETLGWGGFWGWDPVENGPLVPWLSTTALLHALQVNRVRGGLKKSCIFLALFGFIGALYETFLTRTGILDKFSNHSFSTLGGAANNIVLYGLLITTTISLVLLMWRSSRIVSKIRIWENATSREFSLSLSIILLMICAIIIAAGMSAPLITGWAVSVHLIANQSSVSPDFFNKANFPEAVLIGIGMAVGSFLTWDQTAAFRIRRLLPSFGAALIVTALYAILGIRYTHARIRPEMLLLFMTCCFAIIANFQILAGRVYASRGDAPVVRTAGGAIAHIGAGLILIGVVGLVLFTHKENPTLTEGRQTTLTGLPYRITFTGMTSDIFHPNNELKFVVASLDGKPEFTVLMPFAVRNVEGTNQILARPAIAMRWWGDLYFAFEDGPEILAPNQIHHFKLSRGQSILLNGVKIKLAEYSVPPAVDAEVAKGVVPEFYPVTANLVVTYPNGRTATVSAVDTRYKDDPIAPSMPEVMLPTAERSAPPEAIAFGGMDPDSGDASFYIRQADLPLFTSYTIEVSTRPTIGFVWIGTLLIFAGGLMSMARRASENRHNPPIEPRAGSKIHAAIPSGNAAKFRRGRSERKREVVAQSSTVGDRN